VTVDVMCSSRALKGLLVHCSGSGLVVGGRWIKLDDITFSSIVAPVAHSEWVCGTLCRRSPLPWSCRHFA